MHRLIARLLLLFTLAASLAPVALAATAAPPHACCLRKGVHRCHDSQISDDGPLVLRDASCCNQQCGRAKVSSQWAQAQPRTVVFFLQATPSSLAVPQLDSPVTASTEFHSTRAPPYLPSQLS
jgi:hypothetical protein